MNINSEIISEINPNNKANKRKKIVALQTTSEIKTTTDPMINDI